LSNFVSKQTYENPNDQALYNSFKEVFKSIPIGRTDREFGVFLDIVFITYENGPVISEKVVPGLQYTVDQLISTGNCQLSLKGKITGQNIYQTDGNKINQLNFLLNSGEIIKLDSIYVNLILGLDPQTGYKVKNFKFDQIRSNETDFEIELVTTTTTDLIVDFQPVKNVNNKSKI